MVMRSAVSLFALGLAFVACPARAQLAPRRVLESYELARADGAWEIEVRFSTPVRYLRHAPQSRGATLQIQILPISVSPADAPLVAYEQSLPAPDHAPIPLESVVYEGLRASGRFVVLHFARAVAYSVRPGRDMRSIVVSVADAARPPAPATETAAAPAPQPPAPKPAAAPPTTAPTDWEAQSPQLLASGRAALESGDLDAAIRIFTKLQGFPEHAATPDAKELLGLARERRGQLAHAKAEYEEYLARYPDGDAAARVRQRLDALVTAQSKLPPPKDASGKTVAASPLDLDLFGSTYTQYRYERRDSDPGDALVTDSSLWTDGTFVGRLRTPDWSWRGQAAGSHLFQFADTGDSNDTRVSSLFVEAKQNEGGWRGIAGRQSGNTGGVYSRFDGLRVSRRIAPKWRVGLVGGAPVEYWRSSRPSFDRYAYGLSVETERLFEHVDGSLYAVQQRTGDLMDRSAVGLELRWADERRFAAALIDYDVLYASLNTALLNGHWQVNDATSLSFYFDYRNSPTLSTTNATIGQGTDEVGDLSDRYSDSEIRRLAEDRTARSTIASIAATRQLTQRLQLGLDFSVSKLGGTPASGGVDEMEGTGLETSLYPQLVVTGLFREGEVGSVGVRWFDGDASDTWSLIVNERLPITRRLRLNPRLRVDYRTSRGSDEFTLQPDDPDAFLPEVVSATRERVGSYTVRPYFGAEYRVGHFTFDLDGGVEWTLGSFDGGDGSDELAYIMSFGVRLDF
jgi:hypothetical protein